MSNKLFAFLLTYQKSTQLKKTCVERKRKQGSEKFFFVHKMTWMLLKLATGQEKLTASTCSCGTEIINIFRLERDFSVLQITHQLIKTSNIK